MKTFNVVIVGAGPAGTACAIELANLGVNNVLLLHQPVKKRMYAGENIAPSTRLILQSLRIWDAFLSLPKLPCHGIKSIWGNALNGFNDAILSPYGMGWHLDRHAFDTFMIEQAVSVGTQLTLGRYVTHQQQTDNQFEVSYYCDNTLHRLKSHILIDATGKKAHVLSHNDPARHRSTDLVAYTHLLTKQARGASQTVMNIESCPYGWWYCASLPDDKVIVSLTTLPSVAKQLHLHQQQPFMSLLEQTQFYHAISEHYQPTGKTSSYSTPSFCRLNIVTGGMIAVGDAACSFDTITACGIAKAIETGKNAAMALTQALQGQPHALFAYQDEIKAHYQHYLDVRKTVYQNEQRWPNAPFWKTMHG